MYLAIEGVIGVGKTSLARLLQAAFSAEVLLEVFEENPFLSDFYSDRARYAFQTQIFFLLSRYHQQRRAAPEALAKGTLIADYPFAQDALFPRPDRPARRRRPGGAEGGGGGGGGGPGGGGVIERETLLRIARDTAQQ